MNPYQHCWSASSSDAGISRSARWRLLEADLERALMDKLQQFLLELGKGFAVVARQQRISTETQDFYIDLVFYLLKCFVLIGSSVKAEG
jgi:predicted nuclease of restriction endonuclease-like (RecB) superfamily